jgi:hypothetical protein
VNLIVRTPAALVAITLFTITAVTHAQDSTPAMATVRVEAGTLTYSALPTAKNYVDMRITYEAGYYLVTGVRDVGPGCEALEEDEARCGPDGITTIVVQGDSDRSNSITVDMSDRKTGSVSPASVSVTASRFDQDHVHTKDGVQQKLSCNSLAGDHGSIIDDTEAPSGCSYPGGLGASTFGNGLYMNPKGIVQVGVYCRHDYGSEPCTGVLRLAVRGAGTPSDKRYRIRNGASGFNAKVKLTSRAQHVVKAAKHHVAVTVSTFAGSGANRAQSHPGCAVVRTGPPKDDRTQPCGR